MNPKFKDFLEQNPNIGMLGMFWSLTWRFQLIFLGIYFAVVALIILISAVTS